MTDKIDVVVTWVDDNDPLWIKEKQSYQPSSNHSDSSKVRYRDWGLLKYWFRAMETYAPWVHHIYFVTYGHLPDFLNTSNEKLTVVKHSDFIPEDYLPTFNANAIELNLHRIQGLSNQFLYFNDDVFLLQKVQPEDFFRNGLPVDMLACQPIIANPKNPNMSHIYLNNTLVLAKYFDKRANMKQQPNAYFNWRYPLKYLGYNLLETAFPQMTGFYTTHSIAPFLKSSFTTLWDKEYALCHATSLHRFRNDEDLSDYVIREWQKLSGQFVPANTHKDVGYYEIKENNAKLIQHITHQKSKCICLNDTDASIDVERVQKEIITAFETILPTPSSFER